MNIKTEKFAIRWDDKEKFIFIKFIGDQSNSDAKEYAAKLRELIYPLKDKGEAIDKAVVDLTEAGKPSPGAREQYMKVTDEFTEGVKDGMIAYVGADAFNEVIAGIIHSFNSFQVKIGYFDDEEKAKEWFKSSK